MTSRVTRHSMSAMLTTVLPSATVLSFRTQSSATSLNASREADKALEYKRGDVMIWKRFLYFWPFGRGSIGQEYEYGDAMTCKCFPHLLALCEEKPPTTGGFPSHRISNVDFYIFFVVNLNKLKNSRVARYLRRHDARVTSLLWTSSSPDYSTLKATTGIYTTCKYLLLVWWTGSSILTFVDRLRYVYQYQIVNDSIDTWQSSI